MFVFVSSPYGAKTKHERSLNARVAVRMCKWITDNRPGEIPIAPHVICSQWWNDEYDRDKAIAWCRSILPRCGKLYQLNVPLTTGMKAEDIQARDLDVEIEIFDLENLPYLDSDLILVPFEIQKATAF